MRAGFHCATCGAWHDELPMIFGADAPDWHDVLPPDEQEVRAVLGSDQCILDDEHFFVRGLLEVPVRDGTESFTWNVWVSLSEANFERMAELWETEGREAEPPYFGWLSTQVPGYPDTLNLKTRVHTQPVGFAPTIELEPTNHPLAVAQHEGITMMRVQVIVESLLHPAPDE